MPDAFGASKASKLATSLSRSTAMLLGKTLYPMFEAPGLLKWHRKTTAPHPKHMEGEQVGHASAVGTVIAILQACAPHPRLSAFNYAREAVHHIQRRGSGTSMFSFHHGMHLPGEGEYAGDHYSHAHVMHICGCMGVRVHFATRFQIFSNYITCPKHLCRLFLSGLGHPMPQPV